MLLDKLLIVDDGQSIRSFFSDNKLEEYFGQIDYAQNKKETLNILEKNSYDLMCIDINLDDAIDGIRLADKILDNYIVPIIFFSAYGDEEIIDEMVDSAPYGIILTPFKAREVLLTFKLALKRFNIQEKIHAHQHALVEVNMIDIAPALCYSLDSLTLFQENKPVRLSLKQNRLIYSLAKNLNNIMTSQGLIEEIWETKGATEHSLRTLVYNTRKVIPQLDIVSFSKTGYMLRSGEG